MKFRSFIAFGLFLTLAGACDPKDNKSDNSAALKIQALDHQIEIKIASAEDYVGGLEEAPRSTPAIAIKQTWVQYKTCSEQGRNNTQAADVQACADSFQSHLTDVLKTVVDTFRSTHTNSFDDLNGQVLSLADKGTAIGQDLEKVKQTYTSCQEVSLKKDFQEDMGRLLRVCELTVNAEIVRLDTAVKTVDVNPIDTF